MIMTGKDVKGSCSGLFQVLYRDLPEVTEKASDIMGGVTV
jgi:hypothetical protein